MLKSWLYTPNLVKTCNSPKQELKGKRLIAALWQWTGWVCGALLNFCHQQLIVTSWATGPAPPCTTKGQGKSDCCIRDFSLMHAGAGDQGLDLPILSLLLQVTTVRSLHQSPGPTHWSPGPTHQFQLFGHCHVGPQAEEQAWENLWSSCKLLVLRDFGFSPSLGSLCPHFIHICISKQGPPPGEPRWFSPYDKAILPDPTPEIPVNKKFLSA